MWKQIVANKKLVITAMVALCAGCVLGILVGLALRSSDPEAQPTGRIGIQTILPTTKMERHVSFTRCEHTEHAALLNEPFIGYTREELQAFYKTCEVTEFSKERVVIGQTVDAACPAHVLLRADGNGALCAYQTDREFFIEQLIRVLPVELRTDMAPEEQTRLREGMLFDSLADVDAYLEGLES